MLGVLDRARRARAQRPRGATRLVLLAVERRLDVLRVGVLVERLIVVVEELVVLQAPRS